MDPQQRALAIAERASRRSAAVERDAHRDLRDRSEPLDLRRDPYPVVEHPHEPPPPARSLDPIRLDDRHREPVKSFACPRCGEPVDGASFYGPCEPCRQELRRAATVGGGFPPKGRTRATVDGDGRPSSSMGGES